LIGKGIKGRLPAPDDLCRKALPFWKISQIV